MIQIILYICSLLVVVLFLDNFNAAYRFSFPILLQKQLRRILWFFACAASMASSTKIMFSDSWITCRFFQCIDYRDSQQMIGFRSAHLGLLNSNLSSSSDDIGFVAFITISRNSHSVQDIVVRIPFSIPSAIDMCAIKIKMLFFPKKLIAFFWTGIQNNLEKPMRVASTFQWKISNHEKSRT